jgi:hypothetical protein
LAARLHYALHLLCLTFLRLTTLLKKGSKPSIGGANTLKTGFLIVHSLKSPRLWS